MKRIVLGMAVLAAATLILTACTTGGGPGGPNPPPTTPTVLSFGDGSAPVYASSLRPGATEIFEFTAPADVDQVIVFELDQELRLVQRDPSGGVVALSETAEYFGPGIGLASTGRLAQQAIVTTAPCRGSCIVVRGAPGDYFFEVSNPTGASVAYSVYLYDSVATDTAEPNGTLAEAAIYTIDTEDEGAIETLFDTDWWLVQSGEFSEGSIIFEAAGDIDIVLYVDPLDGGRLGPFASGSEVFIVAGDALEVQSRAGHAARGVNGYYYLSPAVTSVPLGN